jgi:ABC-2 type transport system ATP-binding protein
VTLRLASPVGSAELQRLGAVIANEPTQAVLRVPQAELRGAVAHLLSQLPVTDLTVEDPPLEEVLRELFQTKAPAPKATATATGTAKAPGGAR